MSMRTFFSSLPLCMLLLITLLRETATSVDRDDTLKRRFIEFGSEQAPPVLDFQRHVRKGVKEGNLWHYETPQEAKAPRKVPNNPLRASAGSAVIKSNSIAAPNLTLNGTNDEKTANRATALSTTPVRYGKEDFGSAKNVGKKYLALSLANSTVTNQILDVQAHLKPFALSLTQRVKRQQTARALKSPNNAAAAAQHFNLPVVPLPPPPPFTANFAISPFAAGGGSAANNKHNIYPNAFAFAGNNGAGKSSSSSAAVCGGVLKTRYGSIQTPNFPHKFVTPIECVWVIDASELPIMAAANVDVGSNGAQSAAANISIIVYLTQLYVLGGLKFTEYMYYSDDYKVPAHRVFTLTEDDVTQVAWVQFSSQYLEIRFTMTSLDGTHLRALDRLLDVYGFNITYEVQQEVKPYQCNTLQCRFLGHCYAKADYSSYYCSCFAGFSGIDCGRGPLCEDPHTNICQNGGTCKHIGDAAITCHCPGGFKGTKCEIPEISEITRGSTSNSTSSDCHRECDFERIGEGNMFRKTSKVTARNGKTRYEVTIRLGANLTAYYRSVDPERRPSDHLPSLLERHLSRVLRNFNITKISDLELISNSTDRLDITFHFFGIKGDSNRIREAITRMVERGRIGNITLVSNYHLFDENPPLNLLEMTINQKSAIREDSEFIISCTAQGSSRMQFQWYKDGAIVNTSKATREIWTTVLPPETKDTFTAILGITKASRMDEGIYTCKVNDWGVEQCRSLHVHIKSPPRLRVDPASVTLQRGDSLRVRCLSPGNDDIKRYAQLGYSWTRNGVLFQSNPATVMWEDLYPDGSILKINNIQKSAEYTCIVSNTVRPVSRSVYITVIDRNAVHVCHTDALYGVRWPTSAPGAAIVADCPRGFEGHSRRICESRDSGNSTWLPPDFSLCIQDQLLLIYNKFRALSAGYQQTNSSAILKACFEYAARRHKRFLPGEAGFLIDMLQEVDTYLQLRGTQLEREMAAEIILHILDKVMQNTESLNSQQQIKKLQLLTQSAALNRETIAASQLATSTSTSTGAAAAAAAAAVAATATGGSATATVTQTATSATTTTLLNAIGATTLLRSDGALGNILTVDEDSLSLDRLNSLRIYMTSVRTLPFNLRIYGDDLFSDQLYMDIGLSTRLLNIMANSTIFASVISYKNLKSFLPKTYYTRGSDPKESDYILASRILQTWLFQSNRSNDNLREPLDLSFEAGHVEIIFQHEAAPKDGDWVAVCGHDYKASFESTWRSDLCITKNLMENITRCICPLSGTYVVMLTKRNYSATPPAPAQRPLFIIISCASCLLQSCSAFLILLPIWYNRKCAITFLKMQFCVSTSSIMLIFLLGFLKMIPVNWQAIVNSSLASLLLLGISTLIAIALVINSELVPQKYFHINKLSAAAASNKTTTAAAKKEQQQQQQELGKRRNSTSGTGGIASRVGGIDAGNISVTNITQISSNTSSGNSDNSNDSAGGVGKRSSRSCSGVQTPTASTGASGRVAGGGITPALVQELYFPVSVRAVIGISWLLPLLFAIAAPLVCSVIGKWPRNWWLEVMSNTTTTAAGGRTATTMPFTMASMFLTTSTATSSTAAAAVRKTTATTARTDRSRAAGDLSSHDYLLAQPVSPTLLTNGGSNTNNLSMSASSSGSSTFDVASPAAGAALSSTSTASSAATAEQLSTGAWATHQSNFLQPQPQPQTPLPQQQTPYASANYNDFGSITGDPDPLDYVGADGGDLGGGEGPSPSLSFIIFICVDLLFVLLFCALFVVLIKKLLWLWHRNRNVQPHPLDKFNVAMRRRMGLVYRTGCLLLMKLTTDALYIAYVNSTHDSWWSYPFGISCLLLGTTILICFVIKAECSLRAPPASSNSINSTSAALKKKLSSSKTSLDENYCTGSINSPLSFYASHEKEKENDSGAPQQHIEISSGVQLPLTIIPTATRCTLLPPTTAAAPRIKSFLNASNLEHKQAPPPPHISCLQETTANTTTITSPATRCCNILGGSGNDSGTGGSHIAATNMVGGMASTGVMGYYDSYGAGMTIGMTGSLKRLPSQQQHHGGAQEFVGVETLDILQGVAPDSIIGIRTHSSNTLPHNASYHHHHHQLAAQHAFLQKQQQHVAQLPKVYVDATMLSNAATIVSISSLTPATNYTDAHTPTIISATNVNTSGSGIGGIIATTTATTQTPKAQKRVTIMEPTTHTFDPLLPTMVAVSGAATPHHPLVSTQTSAPTPIIASSGNATGGSTAEPGDIAMAASDNSSPDDENSLNGMLDRITHDLDYLLNRTNEPPPTDTATSSALTLPAVELNVATAASATATLAAVASPTTTTGVSGAAVTMVTITEDTVEQI